MRQGAWLHQNEPMRFHTPSYYGANTYGDLVTDACSAQEFSEVVFGQVGTRHGSVRQDGSGVPSPGRFDAAGHRWHLADRLGGICRPVAIWSGLPMPLSNSWPFPLSRPMPRSSR